MHHQWFKQLYESGDCTFQNLTVQTSTDISFNIKTATIYSHTKFRMDINKLVIGCILSMMLQDLIDRHRVRHSVTLLAINRNNTANQITAMQSLTPDNVRPTLEFVPALGRRSAD